MLLCSPIVKTTYHGEDQGLSLRFSPFFIVMSFFIDVYIYAVFIHALERRRPYVSYKAYHSSPLCAHVWYFVNFMYYFLPTYCFFAHMCYNGSDGRRAQKMPAGKNAKVKCYEKDNQVHAGDVFDFDRRCICTVLVRYERT